MSGVGCIEDGRPGQRLMFNIILDYYLTKDGYRL